MNNFGFNIMQPRLVDVKDSVQDRLQLLEKRVPTYKKCIKCGGCTATCPTGNLTPYNIRKIHSLFLWGENDGLDEELQKCMLCGKCTLVCPRGVNLRDLIINLQKVLSKQNK